MADVISPLAELHSGCTREMARIQLERDAARKELAEAKEYAQALRTATELLIDAVTREQSPSVMTSAIVEEAKQVLAGKARWTWDGWDK